MVLLTVLVLELVHLKELYMFGMILVVSQDQLEDYQELTSVYERTPPAGIPSAEMDTRRSNIEETPSSPTPNPSMVPILTAAAARHGLHHRLDTFARRKGQTQKAPFGSLERHRYSLSLRGERVPRAPFPPE